VSSNCVNVPISVATNELTFKVPEAMLYYTIAILYYTIILKRTQKKAPFFEDGSIHNNKSIL